MTSRPRIGITSRKVPYFHRDRPYPRFGVAVDYIHAVEAAGGLPLMIPLVLILMRKLRTTEVTL